LELKKIRQLFREAERGEFYAPQINADWINAAARGQRKGRAFEQASARQGSPDQDSATACHRFGKEPASTRPACQPVVSWRR
jgi:hypothetical protein